MTSLLLSDLHLPAQPSPLREAFIGFLEGPARRAQQVYLLGDLFEYWIGDDVGLQVYAAEVSRLAALSAKGVALFFMPGNRDFLVGEAFAQMTGAQILGDPALVTLGGTPTLLSHGDLFCSDDVGYQRWRRFSRHRAAQRVFLSLPLSWRQRIAGGLRGQSDEGKARKDAAIMDVNETTVAAAFERYRVERIIHGHTHRPWNHRYPQGRERIVLADWTPARMEYLQVDGDRLERVRL